MKAQQSVFKTRREYNKWVGNQTLEDYALRFTAKKARRLSIDAVGKTALGATAFLALEALSAAATLQYGFTNTLYAMLAVAATILLTGIPITYHAAKNGLDIDLLTRGAGFGYLGSTITSLVYASFTFIFFAIEAAILASALKALFNIPLAIGYILCVLAVIPIVTHGITAISRFQIGSQTLWLSLQCTALAAVAYYEFDQVADWTAYTPEDLPAGSGFDLALFGACSSIFFALIAQIGEQVDYLRFLPDKTRENRKRWWFWMLFSGPGWISIGLVKMLFGSFLAYLAIRQLQAFEQAIDPVYMYQMAFSYIAQSPSVALIMAGVMVIISQMKINVTNAYAGSIAWSNFFSRLTHSHPGRVVWLLFNMIIALTLMELGMYRSLEAIVSVFALVAISWLGSLSADLLINRRLKISPQKIEFKRSHLYDVNPVGFGSMIIAIVLGFSSYMGYLGESARHLAHYVCLFSCYISVPLIGWLTQGRYYLARTNDIDIGKGHQTCGVCENVFEGEDMTHCPAYGDIICSLCCSLDARCMDMCKPAMPINERISHWLEQRLPSKSQVLINPRAFRFVRLFFGIAVINAALLVLTYMHNAPDNAAGQALLEDTLWTLFYVLCIVFGVLSWLIVLAHESRRIAQQESNYQTQLLLEEIGAHEETDAELQSAKEVAEEANEAKSRYLSGISHELRTPLQSVLGYAQLLEQNDDIAPQHQRKLGIIRSNGEHLANLIEGLLEISKIEAGRLEIFQEEVDISEVLNQLIQIFQPQAEAKGLNFHFHLHQGLPHRVKTDEKRLKQILINLLSNAIKYTEQGQVDFHVRYRNQVAEFTVEDTGVGIGEEDLERILAPFERVRNPRLLDVNGTGLGLTIVHLLTEVLGGSLEVKSTPDKGSRFSVSLMLSWVSKPKPEAPCEKKIGGYEGDERTVLVVDDEAAHRNLIVDILTPIGFNTLEAQGAKTCLDIIASTEPDLIILDVNMPLVSGFDLAKTLRAQGYNKPIMMLSADATESHQSDTSETRSYNHYMTKPIRNRELIERVGELMDLTWRFEKGTLPKPIIARKDKIKTLPLPPSSPLVDHILEAAKVGYKRGVMDALSQLEDSGDASEHFIEHIRKLAELMRFDKIESLLQEPHKP